MQHNTWGKDRDDLSSLTSKVITEGYEGAEDAECPLDIESLDAQQYGDLLHSMFKLTMADAEEVGDPAFKDTAKYLGLAHKAYQNRRESYLDFL
jgi:hypothetical protein